MQRSDFSAWNFVYMVMYFFNVVTIGSTPVDRFQIASLILICCFQAIIFTLLLFSKNITSAIPSIIIPSVAFIPWSIFAAIFDPVQAFFIPLTLCLIIIVAGIPRARILKRMRDKFPEILETKNPGIDEKPRDNSRENRHLIAIDVCTTFAVIASMIIISMVFVTNIRLVSWMISMFVIVPAFLVVLDLFFNIFQKQRRMIYHPLLTHHFIEESNHTFSVSFGNVSVFFCTRCAGMLIGLFLSIYAFVAFKIALPPLIALIVDCFLPVPIFVDWGTQRLGLRESTTKSRVITGAIVGLGFALVPQASPDYALESAILLMTYFVIFISLFVVGTRFVAKENDDEPNFFP